MAISDELLEMLYPFRFDEQQMMTECDCMKHIYELIDSFYFDYRLTPTAVLKNLEDKNISTLEELLIALLEFKNSLQFLYEKM